MDISEQEKHPEISIIIPAYNHEAFVAEAIFSVLEQDFKDLEIIVIDDGSTDHTAVEVTKIKDNRIQLIQQENQGTHAALNRGISLAKGEYISILNSDDRYMPERLGRLKSHLDANPQYGMAVTWLRLIDSQGEQITAGETFRWVIKAKEFYEASGNLLLSVIRDNLVSTSSNFFFRRSCIDRIGRFKPLRYCNDIDFLLNMIIGEGVGFFDETLLEYRVHEGNTIREKALGFDIPFDFELTWVLAQFLWQYPMPAEEIDIFISGISTRYTDSLLETITLQGLYFNAHHFDSDKCLELITNIRDPSRKAITKHLHEKEEKEASIQRMGEWIQELTDQIRDKERDIVEIKAWMKKLEQQLAEKNASHDEMQGWISELETQLSRQAEAFLEINGWAEDLQRQVVEKDDTLRRMDLWANDLLEQIQNKEERIQEIEEIVSDFRRVTEGQNSVINELEGRLQVIYQSKSWRVANQVKTIGKKIRLIN